MEPDYCDTAFGSSTLDLVHAACENGLAATVVKSIGASELINTTLPAILHVRPRHRVGDFVHWILLVETDGINNLTILDPSFGLETMTLAEVISRFDGNMILVGESEQAISSELRSQFGQRMMKGLVISFLLACFVLVLNCVPRRFGKKTAVVLIPISVFLAVASAFAYNTFYIGGLLAAETELAKSLAEFSNRSFPLVSYSDFALLVKANDPKIALVDARFTEQYHRSSIDNAVNYPIDISTENEIQLLKQLEGKQTIIVFCQSEGCPFSDHIARRLAELGFRDVRIFRGGINTWNRPDM